ncbi:MAG: homoserine dehydrogenase [Anaerolineae bacterium]|nr:homoserine dehydrogenase [Anaerolineae bacterium]
MRDVPLIIFGVGGVGRALLRQIIASRRLHADRFGLFLRVVAVVDSSGAVVAPSGLGDKELSEIEQAKAGGLPLVRTPTGREIPDARSVVDMVGVEEAIVVDCTASEAIIPALEVALERGYGVVLANKKPLTGSLDLFRRLTASGRIRHEATVGAGTPIVATMAMLIRSGDEIRRVVGSFSGTLGYLMTEVQSGRPFSEAVSRAHRMGYTEPDPRDDLGGIDVARKALILARMLGWELDLSDVAVESLYPVSLANTPVSEFLTNLSSLDREIASRAAAAEKEGKVLRYVAEIAEGRCEVGLRAVPAESPLGRLRGSDNLAEFHTRWYNPHPLVLQGRGAGVNATAAGVLADIVELALSMV